MAVRMPPRKIPSHMDGRWRTCDKQTYGCSGSAAIKDPQIELGYFSGQRSWGSSTRLTLWLASTQSNQVGIISSDDTKTSSGLQSDESDEETDT